ncbi:hypothetical protein HZY88_04845 [Aerococcaceae bacterium DSM 111176]|nr:hypothetical protein [Aerococcaceae bacterium DSM 111176]
MNFCPQCGISLKDVQDNCPNCNQVIKEIQLEPLQTAENITKSPVFDYTKIIKLINFMQHNFYLNFIFGMLLFTFFFIFTPTRVVTANFKPDTNLLVCQL